MLKVTNHLKKFCLRFVFRLQDSESACVRLLPVIENGSKTKVP